MKHVYIKANYWIWKEKICSFVFIGLLFCILSAGKQTVVSAADAANAPKKGSVIAGYLNDPEMGKICAKYSYQAPKCEITATYQSISEMRENAEGLQDGDYIQTENYYENIKGGGAVYQVEASSYTTDNGGTIINLPGAFRCKLVSGNNTVSPLQFGAYGDGKTDDHTALQSTFTSGFQTVIMEGRTYISNDTIWMANCNNLLIEGMGATITCDNGFGSYQKEGQKNNTQVYVTNCTNVTFRHIRFIDGQTTDHKRGLVTLQSVRNVDITYCTLLLPAGLSSNPNDGSCNLSFCNGWHDVSTTHCEIINESGLKTGGAVGYNDIYASGSENALFENNIVRYNTKDEVIAIFSHSKQGSEYFGRNSYIRNIMIRHNEFYGPKSDNWTRDLDFSVGYEDSLEIDNVVYEENYFETDAVWAFMTFSKTATNCAARGNVIHVNQTSSQTSMSVFKTTGEFPAVISDNIIEISSENENIPSSIVSGKLHFQNNQVTTTGDIQYLFAGGAVSEQNQITVNGSVKKAVSYQGGDMTNTSITIWENAGSMYESYIMDMLKDIVWKENVINLPNAISTGALMTFNGMKMNGHQFIMEKNEINTPSAKKDAFIIYDNLRDENPKEQTIILKGNRFGAYNSKGNTVQIYRTGNVFQLADKSTITDDEPEKTPPEKPVKKNTKVIPKKGTLLTDRKTKAVYKVTSSSSKNTTVAYVKPISRKASTVTIAKTVTINKISYKITSIASNAFRGCKNLKRISIGSEIRVIGKKAFYGCKKLQTISFKTKRLTDKKVGSYAFKGISSKAVVNVPKEKLNSYRKFLKKKNYIYRISS